jgi:hypothetical protein
MLFSPGAAKFWSGFIGGVTRLRTSVTRKRAVLQTFTQAGLQIPVAMPTLRYQSAGSHPPSIFQGVSLSEPFSTRAFMSEYAVSMSLLSDAASVAVPGLSFTWRMNLPVPCNKRVGSGSAAP